VLALRQRGINANYLASTQLDRRGDALRRLRRPPGCSRWRFPLFRVRSSVAGDAAAGRIDLLYVSPERAMALGGAFFAGIMRARCVSTQRQPCMPPP
jgi:superfamily II DNA helicase RecQ